MNIALLIWAVGYFIIFVVAATGILNYKSLKKEDTDTRLLIGLVIGFACPTLFIGVPVGLYREGRESKENKNPGPVTELKLYSIWEVTTVYVEKDWTLGTTTNREKLIQLYDGNFSSTNYEQQLVYLLFEDIKRKGWYRLVKKEEFPATDITEAKKPGEITHWHYKQISRKNHK